MAAGHELSTGEFKRGNRSDDELWSAISNALSDQVSHDTSYKFAFLKSIIDNLYNADENLVLSFDKLFSTFTELYWNLVLKYNLYQKVPTKTGKISAVEKLLKEAKADFLLPDGIPYESLSTEQMIKINHKVKIKCKQNVVGALFADTKELFYGFSRSGEWIQINPVMYEFVCKHKLIIEKLNYYQWAKFMEKVNESDAVSHLLSKIDESSKRNNLAAYRKILFDEFENKCFYCGKKVSNEKVDVDHFIPWSYIKNDNLWNFVLACPSCNRSKSDKLASEKYLDILVERNRKIIVSNNYGMSNYNGQKLRALYYWAKINGLDADWSPKNKEIIG